MIDPLPGQRQGVSLWRTLVSRDTFVSPLVGGSNHFAKKNPPVKSTGGFAFLVGLKRSLRESKFLLPVAPNHPAGCLRS